ncbi:MAG: hypothetical protein H0T42_23055 [Deltaproteobacteria bacterium]|nr:hypothetical protein [Deltaproteobacteria bacterium]
MRVPLPWLILVAAACGGSSPQPTTPANTAPPSPGPVAVAPPAADKAACANHPEEFGPYILTADQAAARYGKTATRFSDAPTTKDKAIEVCGIPAQQAWLMKTSCADSSKAFSSPGQIPGSRRGNVGEGGRCGAIIDLYIAKCPEAEYEVHIDMYMCGPGEQF